MSRGRCWMMKVNRRGRSIQSVHQEYMPPWIIRGPELQRRRQEILQVQQSESRIFIEDKEIDGINMENLPLQLAQRHTSRVIMYKVSRPGDRMSLLIEIREQLNPIDFKRPTEVMANGPDGQVTSGSHSRTTGVNLLCGSRLPAMTARGRVLRNGRDHNGLPRLEGP